MPTRDRTPGVTTVVELDRSFPETQAAHDRLLRVGEPAVHVVTLRTPAVSYGVGVPSTATYLARARAEGVEVVRRTSGGTGLVHLPGDLVWGVVLPRTHPLVGRDFVRAYPRLGSGVVELLKTHDVRAEWVAPPGLSAEYCPLSSRGHVLAVGGQVLGAAAQHATGAALLHHGILPRAIDRVRINRWYELPTPGPADRLTSLEELEVPATPAVLAEELASYLASSLDATSAR